MCRRFFRTTMRKRSCRSERALLIIATSSLARTPARLKHVIPCIAVDQLPVDLHVTCGRSLWDRSCRRYGAFSSRYVPVVSAQLLPPSICVVVMRPQSFLVFRPILCRTDFKPAQRPPLEHITQWELRMSCYTLMDLRLGYFERFWPEIAFLLQLARLLHRQSSRDQGLPAARCILRLAAKRLDTGADPVPRRGGNIP